jgi:hypothetical protein
MAGLSADPGLEAALAAAAQVAPERLRALRIVPGDGSTSCWHREGVAWCPACVQDDVARWGETYERATWRLGCCVLCPDHGVLLKDQCRRCYPASRAHFWHAGGRMTLICVQCRRLPDPPEGEDTDADDSWFLPFDLMATPELNRAVAILQADLSAALAGATSRPGCFVRSAGGLMDAVACLVIGIALGREMRFEPRVDLFTRAPSKPWAVVYELFTPAAASVYCAFGLLAIVAAVLDSLDGQGGQLPVEAEWRRAGHHRRVIYGMAERRRAAVASVRVQALGTSAAEGVLGCRGGADGELVLMSSSGCPLSCEQAPNRTHPESGCNALILRREVADR